MRARFVGRLLTELLDVPVGKKWFKSIATLDYISKSGKRYTIPTDVNTDFGSVPWGLNLIVPRVGKWGKAVYFHDWLCEYKIVSRKKADALFLEAMEARDLGKIKRGLRYFGTRLYSIVTFKK